MRIAVMQPYLFPYIGYFQLMRDVDLFVLYDDANYIKQGWINRNRVLTGTGVHRFTFPLAKASSFKKINEIDVQIDNRFVARFLRTITFAYKKACFFHQTMALIEDVLKSQDKNLSRFLARTLSIVSNYLGLDTQLVLSSTLDKDGKLVGERRIIDICRILGARVYVNPIGGKHLYHKEFFHAHGVDLKFLVLGEITYKQFGKGFVPNLSIIDPLMFNSIDQMKVLLTSYELC